MARTTSTYPGSIDTFINATTDFNPGDAIPSSDFERGIDAIKTIQTKLGITGGTALLDSAVTVNNSEADKDFRIAAVGATNAFFVQGSDGKAAFGCADIPHGGVGSALLALEGLSSSVEGPHIQITTAQDNYPAMHYWVWQHDNMRIRFDAYYDVGGNKSSDVGSNFQIGKENDLWFVQYDSSVAQGAAISWNNGIVLDTSGKVFINDIANTKALGPSLTIDGAGQDGEYITLQDSTDVAHGITTQTETDTFAQFSKIVNGEGGLRITGYTEGTYALYLYGTATTEDNTRGTAGSGAVSLVGGLKALTTDGVMGADKNLVVMINYDSTKFIFDTDGEMHSDAIIGIGDDWDEWDDLALASDLSRLPKGRFNEMMKYKAKDFEKAGLLTLSVDEQGTQHAFIRHKAMLQFSMCCFSDIHDRLIKYERAFEKLGINKEELLALGV